MSIRIAFLTLITVITARYAVPPQQDYDLDLTVAVLRSSIIAGEPLLLETTVTNRSGDPLVLCNSTNPFPVELLVKAGDTTSEVNPLMNYGEAEGVSLLYPGEKLHYREWVGADSGGMTPYPFAAPGRYLVHVNYRLAANSKAHDCDRVVLTTEPIAIEVVAPTEAERIALKALDQVGGHIAPMRPYGWNPAYPVSIINRVEAAWKELDGYPRFRSYLSFWLAARYFGAGRCADALQVLDGSSLADRPNSFDLQGDYIRGECLIQTGKAKEGWAILEQLPAKYPDMDLVVARKADAYHGGAVGYLRDQITKSLARPRPAP